MAYLSWRYLLPFIILALAFWHFFAQYRREKKIKLWLQQKNVPQHEQAFNTLYQGVNGYLLSKQDRLLKDAFDYVYGEIEFVPFIALLSLVPIDENTVFYDLGSGVGKAAIAASMVFPVKKAIGIEILPLLHQAACQQQKKLLADSKYTQLAETIEFIQGDFLEEDLSPANVIFINSTGLFDPTWSRLCQILDELPQIKTVITTSKPLKSRVLKVSKTCKVQMGWDVVQAFIHDRQTNMNQTT